VFGIFKKNPVPAIVVNLLIAASLWWPAFAHPMQVTDDIPMMPLERWLAVLVQHSPLLSTVAAFAVMYVLALLLIGLGKAHFFSPEQKYLPPFVFVLICSAFPIQKCMNGSYVAALCFMAGLFQLLQVYRSKRVFASIFLAAMFVSIASLFSASAVFLLLLLPIALPLLRTPTHWRDWIIALSGLLTPYLYVCAAYYWREDDALAFFRQLYDCLFSFSNWIFENGRVVEWVYLGYLMVLVVLAMFLLAEGVFTSRVKVQKIYTLFVWSFFIMLLIMVALPSGSMFLLPLMAMPASVLIGNYLTLARYRRISGTLFFLLIILSFVVQYF
jgi:hypothetical protein